MGRINVASIRNKCKKALETSSKYTRAKDAVGIKQCSEAGETLKSVLQKEISSNPNLSTEASTSIGDISTSAPTKIGKDTYRIGVFFSGDLHRPSLAPTQYPDGIENIAALLNNGYEARNFVYGTWNGHGGKIRSRKSRPGAHFVQNAARIFESGYGKKYNIKKIKIKDIYE